MPQSPTGRQLARMPRNDAPARSEVTSSSTPLPRDTAYFPGVSTRGVLARVLVGQIRDGLERNDVEGIRRSCALLEAIWQDVPPETRTVALELAATSPGGAEGLARVAIREGDAELAARLPALPPFMLHDLGKLSEDVTRAICSRDDFPTAILPRLAAQPESARIAVARLYPGVMPRSVRDALLLTVRQSDSALGEALAERDDCYTTDLAADLAGLSAGGRVTRLRRGAQELTPCEAPSDSPLLARITAQIRAMAKDGRQGDALGIVAHLMRVPVHIVTALAAEDDPVQFALGLRGICLEPTLCETLRGAAGWMEHPARDLVEGEIGYPLGRRFIADLRRRASS